MTERESKCETVCVKCGGESIKTRYHDGESYWGDSRHCAYGNAAHPTAHAPTPHLHKTCKTCDFDWVEDTLDALTG